ncbi:hypothetical protein DU508_03035 [Pedobacter chinensis]|uniref:Uncharacterized protein n=1 Tax=Pedobacter chinensis TaxID=2282421 RepID=A0A369Q0C1_9SPHI|nr:hypothetical protein DU508_03035 [Pedobacter chinensis]
MADFLIRLQEQIRNAESGKWFCFFCKYVLNLLLRKAGFLKKQCSQLNKLKNNKIAEAANFI